VLASVSISSGMGESAVIKESLDVVDTDETEEEEMILSAGGSRWCVGSCVNDAREESSSCASGGAFGVVFGMV
jgi:hypothetical protein